MPETMTTLGDVLTLSEAAALLRVEDAPLAELAAGGAVPARKIGEEWRFSRTAILHWLHSGPGCPSPYWPDEASLLEKLALLFESRMGTTLRPSPPPGSKEAVRKCIGVFAGDGDMEEQLARLAAIRKGDAAGVGG